MNENEIENKNKNACKERYSIIIILHECKKGKNIVQKIIKEFTVYILVSGTPWISRTFTK